ncbi:hypothetical protein MTER_42330 [Mycolicibacter terrae]|uniref:Uncharacterized protein n=1 Tax=Mycolicibacter terrae TaxID=1788 RepID=A0AAD1MHK7_9MYCO|nr:hypothetical protein MTER_42330 [Mycolicibacter terrae]
MTRDGTEPVGGTPADGDSATGGEAGCRIQITSTTATSATASAIAPAATHASRRRRLRTDFDGDFGDREDFRGEFGVFLLAIAPITVQISGFQH